MCPQPGRQKSNTLCSPCVMNSKILFSKWCSHYQNLYLEHSKVSHLDARFLHYNLSLLPSSTTVRQVPEVAACFPPNCGIRLCRGHFLVHDRANPNKQSTVCNFLALDSKVWTLQHGAYGKCIIIFVRRTEEKSLFGGNPRWPSRFKPYSSV